jgi:hypothetical protein
VIHRQRGAGQAAEEGRHFPLGQEAGRAFGEAPGVRAAQLRLEDGQRAADAEWPQTSMRAARIGKADQRHQNVLQPKRQQQPFAGAERSSDPKSPALLIIYAAQTL